MNKDIGATPITFIHHNFHKKSERNTALAFLFHNIHAVLEMAAKSAITLPLVSLLIHPVGME